MAKFNDTEIVFHKVDELPGSNLINYIGHIFFTTNGGIYMCRRTSEGEYEWKPFGTIVDPSIVPTYEEILAIAQGKCDDLEVKFNGKISSITNIENEIRLTVADLQKDLTKTNADYSGFVSEVAALSDQINMRLVQVENGQESVKTLLSLGLDKSVQHMEGLVDDITIKSSEFEQTVDGIRANVYNLNSELKSELSQLDSKIEAKIEGSSFNTRLAVAEGRIESSAKSIDGIQSELIQIPNRITAEVTNATGDLESRLTVAEGEIKTKVSSEDFETEIEQLSDQITLTVNKATEALESKLELTEDSIKTSVSSEVFESVMKQIPGQISAIVADKTAGLQAQVELIPTQITLAVNNATEDLESRLELAEDSIKTKVSNSEFESKMSQIPGWISAKVNDKTAGLQAQVELIPTQITAEVTNATSDLNSRLSIAEGKIETKVNSNDYNSFVLQVPGQITSVVESKVSPLRSSIEQLSDRISSIVTDGVNVAEIVQEIKDDKSLINLIANNVNIDGVLTVGEGIGTNKEGHDFFRVNKGGSIEARNAAIYGKITTDDLEATSGTIAGIKITPDSLGAGGSEGSEGSEEGSSFSLDGDGQFRCTNGIFDGEIVAHSGRIGSNIFTEDGFYSGVCGGNTLYHSNKRLIYPMKFNGYDVWKDLYIDDPSLFSLQHDAYNDIIGQSFLARATGTLTAYQAATIYDACLDSLRVGESALEALPGKHEPQGVWNSFYGRLIENYTMMPTIPGYPVDPLGRIQVLIEDIQENVRCTSTPDIGDMRTEEDWDEFAHLFPISYCIYRCAPCINYNSKSDVICYRITENDIELYFKNFVVRDHSEDLLNDPNDVVLGVIDGETGVCKQALTISDIQEEFPEIVFDCTTPIEGQEQSYISTTDPDMDKQLYLSGYMKYTEEAKAGDILIIRTLKINNDYDANDATFEQRKANPAIIQTSRSAFTIDKYGNVTCNSLKCSNFSFESEAAGQLIDLITNISTLLVNQMAKRLLDTIIENISTITGGGGEDIEAPVVNINNIRGDIWESSDDGQGGSVTGNGRVDRLITEPRPLDDDLYKDIQIKEIY